MLTLGIKNISKVIEDRVKGQREGVDEKHFIFKTQDEDKEFQEETQREDDTFLSSSPPHVFLPNQETDCEDTKIEA